MGDVATHKLGLVVLIEQIKLEEEPLCLPANLADQISPILEEELDKVEAKDVAVLLDLLVGHSTHSQMSVKANRLIN